MATNRCPIVKRCKTLGISPAVMGVRKKESTRNQKPNRRKQSEYSLQLTEKQKVKFVYGVLEKQFRKYYAKAEKADGITGEVLLEMLELRLDNVIYRLGFANTRREARQLVNHGHFMVNGHKVDIASYSVKVNDTLTVREKSVQIPKFKTLMEEKGDAITPAWLSREKNTFVGKVVARPQRSDIDFEVVEHLIVELYSK